MLEAVGFKKPVCIGPWATNFKQEVDTLLAVDGLRIVNNQQTLSAFLLECHQNPQKAADMGERGYQAICRQAESLQRNLQRLIEIYDNALGKPD